MRNFNKTKTKLIKCNNCLNTFEAKKLNVKRMSTNNINKEKDKNELYEHKVDVEKLKKKNLKKIILKSKLLT